MSPEVRLQMFLQKYISEEHAQLCSPAMSTRAVSSFQLSVQMYQTKQRDIREA